MNMYTRRECISIGICFVRSSVPIHIYIFIIEGYIEGKIRREYIKDRMPSRSRSISSPKSIHGAWVRLVLLIVNTDAILSSS